MSAEEETPDQRGAKRETPDEGDTVEEKQSRKKSKGDRKTEYKKRTMERLCLKREGTDSRAWLSWLALKKGGAEMKEARDEFLEEHRKTKGFKFVEGSKWSSTEHTDKLKRDTSFLSFE